MADPIPEGATECPECGEETLYSEPRGGHEPGISMKCTNCGLSIDEEG